MFTFDSRKHPNGTILILGITYADRTNELDPLRGRTRGRTEPKVFTYVFLKAGNLWYSTGGPKAPTAAGWPAVERWLSREGRTVAWASKASRRISAHVAPPSVERKAEAPSYGSPQSLTSVSATTDRSRAPPKRRPMSPNTSPLRNFLPWACVSPSPPSPPPLFTSSPGSHRPK